MTEANWNFTPGAGAIVFLEGEVVAGRLPARLPFEVDHNELRSSTSLTTVPPSPLPVEANKCFTSPDSQFLTQCNYFHLEKICDNSPR